MSKKKTQEEFMEELIEELTGSGELEDYDLSRAVYVNNATKVELVCNQHGSKWMLPGNIFAGKRCVECGPKKIGDKLRRNWEDVKGQAIELHTGKYTYENFVYEGAHTASTITCSRHGPFQMCMANHLSGKRCNKCNHEEKAEGRQRLKQERFIEKAEDKHGKGKYGYTLVDYTNSSSKIWITCHKNPNHGNFLCVPTSHLEKRGGTGCPKCVHQISKGELEVRGFIISLGLKPVCNKKVLNRFDIDIFLPELNIGIEYCGIYWHSEKRKADSYHYDKYVLAKSKGIHLIQIFEDEWYPDKREITKNLLRYKLGKETNVIAARKLSILQVGNSVAKDFYNTTHLQGGVTPIEITLGLFKDTSLMACMSFCASNRPTGVSSLTRFSCIGSIPGGFTRLLTNSIPILKELGYNKVISFSDNRISNGEVYEKNGFIKEKELQYDYYWVRNSKRYHKFGFRRNRLKIDHPLEFKEEESEAENCRRFGFYKIFDAGKIRWALSL